MHSIEEVFGEGCDLYNVLNCERDANKAQMRKAYYRTALKVHPDKNPDNPEAAKSFQAVSLAYQILQDPALRQEYDETGVIPHNDALEDEDDDKKSGANGWKQYFDQIFGKVTVSKIDDFAAKYKCSDEERRDVIKEFNRTKGNLVKMLEFVMLSEPRDAVRWVDDYLRPAIEEGEAKSAFRESMEKSLKKLQKQIEKENASENSKNEMDEDDDDEATETEDEEDVKPAPSSAKSKQASKKAPPKKGKANAKAKHKKKDNGNMDDLIAQIQNKNKRGGANVLADLGARYGVGTMAQDPLSDADFAKAQARVDKRRKKR